MVDNKPISSETAQHLKDVDDKYEDRTEDAVDKSPEQRKSEEAYKERNRAYSEGQEEIEAQRKERDAPYEKLSKLVDEHAEAEVKAAHERDKKETERLRSSQTNKPPQKKK